MAGSGRPRRHRRVRETAATGYTPRPEVAGVLYDSDVIIDILRGRTEVIEQAVTLEAGGVPTYTTAIASAEIHAGIRPGEDPVTQAFFDARGEIVIDGIIGRRAGAYLARFAKSQGVEIADALVAASAATAGVRLWTMNRKHYPMPDVQFYEP